MQLFFLFFLSFPFHSFSFFLLPILSLSLSLRFDRFCKICRFLKNWLRLKAFLCLLSFSSNFVAFLLFSLTLLLFLLLPLFLSFQLSWWNWKFTTLTFSPCFYVSRFFFFMYFVSSGSKRSVFCKRRETEREREWKRMRESRFHFSRGDHLIFVQNVNYVILFILIILLSFILTHSPLSFPFVLTHSPLILFRSH